MTSFLDLFDLEGREERDGGNDQPRRKGFRGLWDRLTTALGDDAREQDRSRQGERDAGNRRRQRDDDGFDFFD